MFDMKKKIIIRDIESGDIVWKNEVSIHSTSKKDYFDEAWMLAVEDGVVEDVYRDLFSFELADPDSFI